MPTWTPLQLASFNARRNNLGPSLSAEDAVAAGEEGQLHDEILAYCVTNGLAYIHSPIHRKATQTPGSPDFTIVAREGRVVFVECKTRVGKLDREQTIWHHLAARAGNTVHVVRSMREFYEAMK